MVELPVPCPREERGVAHRLLPGFRPTATQSEKCHHTEPSDRQRPLSRTDRTGNKMKDNSQELFPIVEEDGTVTGSITRGQAHNGSRALHPVVHLHLFNLQGDLYLQHRSTWKEIQPDKWDTACGGHVGYGESIEHALHREVNEELGITDFQAIPLGIYVFESSRERELVYAYKAVYQGNIHPSQEELNGGRFFHPQEIQDALGKSLFTPNFEDEYRRFFLQIPINEK